MNANDFLAQLAGINVAPEVVENEEEPGDYEEISYEEVDAEQFDTFEARASRPGNSKRRVSRGRVAQRELQSLQFDNPGGEMVRFLPDSADIVNANRSRRNYTEKQAEIREEAIHHDKTGKLSTTTKGQTEVIDLCDCLNPDCDGCHWPCATCKSRKCVFQCRQGRRDMIARVEEMFTVEGTKEHASATNPYFPYVIKD
ncbi:hypothetical protein CRE_04730 [Caenorhabditis remanei]|uniref:ARF7 effector protein C-terminal domain-containing protein n=1 Tax=Caenorhabditis remanei TaxID=31234 RepID=E3LYY1_CAERE|nr:hypothetical protein CRE_04730 [Caenorhabditis remanei]